MQRGGLRPPPFFRVFSILSGQAPYFSGILFPSCSFYLSSMLSSPFLLARRKVTQRRAPGDHSCPSCSVVLGAFRKLALRAQTVRNASPSDSVACREWSHGVGPRLALPKPRASLEAALRNSWGTLSYCPSPLPLSPTGRGKKGERGLRYRIVPTGRTGTV